MVNLVTQYNLLPPNRWGNKGWDGASGPYFFHIIHDTYGSTLAEGVGWKGHSDITVEDWQGQHLNNFRLELIYE